MAVNFFVMLGVLQETPVAGIVSGTAVGTARARDPLSSETNVAGAGKIKDVAQKAEAQKQTLTIEVSDKELKEKLEKESAQLSDNFRNILGNKAVLAGPGSNRKSNIVSDVGINENVIEEVKAVQNMLLKLGKIELKDIDYGNPKDAATFAAVTAYQQSKKDAGDTHFLVDGMVGFQTLKAMIDDVAKNDAVKKLIGDDKAGKLLANAEAAFNNGGKQAEDLLRQESDKKKEEEKKGDVPAVVKPKDNTEVAPSTNWAEVKKALDAFDGSDSFEIGNRSPKILAAKKALEKWRGANAHFLVRDPTGGAAPLVINDEYDQAMQDLMGAFAYQNIKGKDSWSGRLDKKFASALSSLPLINGLIKADEDKVKVKESEASANTRQKQLDPEIEKLRKGQVLKRGDSSEIVGHTRYLVNRLAGTGYVEGLSAVPYPSDASVNKIDDPLATALNKIQATHVSPGKAYANNGKLDILTLDKLGELVDKAEAVQREKAQREERYKK